MKHPIKVHWIDRVDQLAELGPRYSELIERGGLYARNFLQVGQLSLLMPFYERELGPMAFLYAERNGEPLALAPMQLERKPWHKGAVRRLGICGYPLGGLSNWQHDWLFVDPTEIEACLVAFRDALTGKFSRHWDLLELEYLHADAPATPLLGGVLGAGASLSPNPAQAASIDLSMGHVAYREGIDGRLKKDMRRYWRQIQERHGTVTVHAETQVSDARFEAMAALHAARQAEMRGKGAGRWTLFEDPERRALFKRSLCKSTEEGQTHFYWLEVDGRLASFWVTHVLGEVGFGCIIAIDSAFDRYSPGKILFDHLIEIEATQLGVKHYHLGLGLNLLKRQFCQVIHDTADLRWINPARIGARARVAWLDFGRNLRSERAEQVAATPEAADGPDAKN